MNVATATHLKPAPASASCFSEHKVDDFGGTLGLLLTRKFMKHVKMSKSLRFDRRLASPESNRNLAAYWYIKSCSLKEVVWPLQDLRIFSSLQSKFLGQPRLEARQFDENRWETVSVALIALLQWQTLSTQE